MTLGSGDRQLLLDSLQIQKRLVEERLKKMQNVAAAIDSTSSTLKAIQEVDWNKRLDLIHLTLMNQSPSTQYQNASNISVRIKFHRDHSLNK